MIKAIMTTAQLVSNQKFKCKEISVCKLEGKVPLWSSRHRKGDNIKMDLK
jgi:hypothetical protein